MPYKIEPNGSKFDVIEIDSGDVVGSHSSKPKALAQLRALYASVPDAGKSGRRNAAADAERLRKIRMILDELLAGEPDGAMQPGPAEQYAEYAEENEPGLDMAYSKSIGLNLTAEKLAAKRTGTDTISGYVALWGSEGRTDVEQEYFTKSTDFWDGPLGKSPRPLTWDHAQDADFKADPKIGIITEFGDDDLGRFYAAKLDTAHRYRRVVDALIDAGKLGTSSDSAPQYVERVKTGKSTWLKTWPWFAAALTITPAEPRMIGSISYLKSLGIELPDAPQAWQYKVALMRRNKFK